MCSKLDTQVINKYNSKLPRYTSFPPATELKSINNFLTLPAFLKETIKPDLPLSLYLHLPFCPSLCYFCACNKIITQKPTDIDNYLSLLSKEFILINKILGFRPLITQIHLGGGSPSYLTVSQIQHLLELLKSNLELKTIERSVELDPRTATEEKIHLLSEYGFTRFSLGVQDFDPGVQKLIHRIQPFELVSQVTEWIKKIPSSRLNFDLLYGLPGQDLSSFDKTIEHVIKLNPDRIALYGYAHVQWKAKVQNVFDKYKRPDVNERLNIFRLAETKLTNSNYNFIGLDHFALPKDELSLALAAKTLRRNFMGYTVVSADGILGVGTSALSDIQQILYQNDPTLTGYESALQAQRLPISKIKIRSTEDNIRAYCIEQIMCYRELDFELVTKAFPNAEAQNICKTAIERLNTLEKDGLCNWEGSKLKVTKLGGYLLRNISAVFDDYLMLPQSSERFSQAV